MKRILILLILFSSQVFSQTPSNTYLKKIASLTKYPNIYVVLPILPRDSKHYNYHAAITNKEMHDYYLESISKKIFPKYESYLRAVIDRKIIFDLKKGGKLRYEAIPKDLTIYAEFKTNGINFIIKKYLDSNGGNLRNKLLDRDVILGLMQVMFYNNFVVSFDDYSGFYNFRRI